MKLLNNGIAVLENDTHVSKWIEESGRLDHDQYLLPVLLPHIKKDAVVIDAGALYGDHTIAYAKQAYLGKVMAFEPNIKAFECLQHNMKNLPNVTAFNCGLGDESKKVSFGGVLDNVGASWLVPDVFGSTPIITLDSLHLHKCDFLKLDIEGFELFALKGAVETIRRCSPTIVVEINHGALSRNNVTASDVFVFLHTLGYTFSCEQRFSYEEPQYDILAVKS